jgi:YceI-like domain
MDSHFQWLLSERSGLKQNWIALAFPSRNQTIRIAPYFIKIQAASVDTGSGMKNGKLKGKDFFDVEQNPVITSKENESSGLSWT